MRITENFNNGWKFILDDSKEYAYKDYDDTAWQILALPHDWSVEYPLCEDAPTGGGGGFAKAGTGWYRKIFEVVGLKEDERVSVLFDGAYMSSEVYINEEKVVSHAYGYTPFYADITEHINEGKNLIAVRVDNSHQPNSRWYSGSGIYRNVSLIRTGNVHFDMWGLQYDTNGIYPTQDIASIQLRATLVNEGESEVYTGVIHELYDAEGKLVTKASAGICLAAGEKGECETRPDIKSPHLWTDRDPYLYTLVSSVLVDGEAVDRMALKVGIRTATFDCDKGFLLNGESVKIKGMCLHHDCGLSGAVGHPEIWKRRLMKLKDMGCNGIRCAHNPPTPEFLNLCDELGFLVMDEICDEWMLGKNKNHNYFSEKFSYGYSQFFKNNVEADLVKMIHRDFNHPSVILWSIGNEIPEQASKDGASIAKFLQDICHREDRTRKVTTACDNIASVPAWSATDDFLNTVDVVGYNYTGRWRNRSETFYEEDRKLHPTWCMLGSENPSVGGIRGNYEDEGMFFSRYEISTVDNEALWRFTATHDYVAGDYLWTGIDYLGETRWPHRGAASGPLDTAGFEKDSYYYFKSIWNDTDITLHLLPHWNWQGQEGIFKHIICYTNCDEVKLYINDRLVGTKGLGYPRIGAQNNWFEGRNTYRTTNDLHLSFDVPYEPGELKAVGYREGKIVAEKILRTTKEAERLSAKADVNCIKPGGLVQIEISVTDLDGLQVPTAEFTVGIKIDGPAHLVGMDAGNLKDLSLYTATERKMFAGALLAVVMADGPGRVSITFESEGLEPVTVFVDVE